MRGMVVFDVERRGYGSSWLGGRGEERLVTEEMVGVVGLGAEEMGEVEGTVEEKSP